MNNLIFYSNCRLFLFHIICGGENSRTKEEKRETLDCLHLSIYRRGSLAMEKKEKKWREWIESLAAIYKVSDHIHATEKVSKRILILKVRCEVRNQRLKTNCLSNKKKIKIPSKYAQFWLTDIFIVSLKPLLPVTISCLSITEMIGIHPYLLKAYACNV